MAEGDVPSPATTLIYFILVTLVFLVFTFFNISKSSDIVTINNSKDSNVINFIYILFIIIGSYFLNVHNSRMICDQNIEWNYILIVTIMPWLVIFIILYFILKLFPGWVSPFSNTIGYLFVTMLGVTNVLEKIMADAKIEEEPDLVKAINTIKNNKSQFINQIDLNLSNFETFISQLKQAKIIQYGETSDEPIIKLYKLITIKHVIGKIVWYVLAGILISSISYNYIIGISCEKSVDQIIKDYEEANPEEEK
jgi:hypothetical protein